MEGNSNSSPWPCNYRIFKLAQSTNLDHVLLFIVQESSTTLPSACNLCFDNTPLKTGGTRLLLQGFSGEHSLSLYWWINNTLLYLLYLSFFMLFPKSRGYTFTCLPLQNRTELSRGLMTEILKQTVNIIYSLLLKKSKMSFFAALTAEDLK